MSTSLTIIDAIHDSEKCIRRILHPAVDQFGFEGGKAGHELGQVGDVVVATRSCKHLGQGCQKLAPRVVLEQLLSVQDPRAKRRNEATKVDGTGEKTQDVGVSASQRPRRRHLRFWSGTGSREERERERRGEERPEERLSPPLPPPHLVDCVVLSLSL